MRKAASTKAESTTAESVIRPKQLVRFMIYHLVDKKIDTTVDATTTGTAHPSVVHEFTLVGFFVGSCCSIFSSLCSDLLFQVVFRNKVCVKVTRSPTEG